MKQLVIAGTLAGALALGGTAFASQAATAPQTPKAQTPTTQTPTPSQGATTTKKPAAKRHMTKAPAEGAQESHTAPKEQPTTASAATVTDRELALGSVHIPKEVKADGKPLPAGTYQVRLTPDTAKPDAPGATQDLERWVEFVKGGKVVGREVVSIVPKDEAHFVTEDTPPRAGQSKVQTLKGGDYVRVWINKGGNYYLVHLVP
jgi:hypothetical protein